MKKIFGLLVQGGCWSAALLSAVVLLGHLVGIRTFITMSGSMEPEVQTGSLCLVNTKADYEQVKEGDIIAFYVSSHVIVTHRVIAVSKDGLETKGDANRTADLVYVTEEDFLGTTFFSIPWLGYGLYYLQKPICFGIGLTIAVTVILWEWVDQKYQKEKSGGSKE